MWRTRTCTAAAVASALGLWACGGPRMVNLSPPPAAEVVKQAPDWLLKPPSDPQHLYAAATATSRDLQVAMQKARLNAQTELAQQLNTRLANLSKQFQEETGLGDDSGLLSQFSSATKAVASQTLEGARVAQQELRDEKGVYRAYVLMDLPLGQANRLVLEKLKRNQDLYTRFRATQAYGELDQEMQKAGQQAGQ